MFSARVGLKKTVLTLLAMACSSAWATSKNYIGQNNVNFNTATNWSPTGVPANLDDVTLGNENPTNATGNFTVTLNTTEPSSGSYNSLTVNSSALPAFMIVNQTAGTLNVGTINIGTTIGDNTYNQSGGSLVSASALNIGSAYAANSYNISGTNTTLSITKSGNIDIGVSGGGTFTQGIGTTVSAGNVILGDSASSSGIYNISGGSLTSSFGTLEVGAAGSGTVNQTGGDVNVPGIVLGYNTGGTGTYNFSGGTIEGSIFINSNSAFNLQTGGIFQATATVDTGGSFKMVGGSFGTSASIDLEGGSLQLLGYNATLASFRSLTGGTVSNGAGTPSVLTVNMLLEDNTPTVVQPYTFVGNMNDGSSGSLGLSVTGGPANGLGLDAANSYTGPTTVTALLQAEAANVFSPNSPVTVNTNGTLDTQGFAETIGSLAGTGGIVNVSAGGSLSIGGLNTSTSFSGYLTGAGTITKTGGGILTLNSGGTFTGTIAISGGTLAVGTSNGIPTSASVTFSGIGGTLNIGANQTLASLSEGDLNAVSFSNNAILTVGTNNGNSTLGASFSGAGTLTFNSSGTYSLGYGTNDTIANTDSSLAMVVNSGTLNLDKAADTTAVAGPLTINNGTVILTNSNQIADTSVVTINSGTLNLNGNFETIGGISGTSQGTLNVAGGALTLNNTTDMTFSGTVTSTSGEIVQNGTANSTFTNVSGFQGQYVVNSGQLTLQGSVASSNYVVYPGGTLEFVNALVNNPGAEIYVNYGGTVEYSGGTISNAYLRGGGTNLVLANTKFNGVTTYNSTVITQNGSSTFENFTNGGTFNNNANLTFNGVTNEASGIINVNYNLTAIDFTNEGVINIANGGNLTTNGSVIYLGGGSRMYVNADGTGGNVSLSGGATLEVNGALLVNDGEISGPTDVNYGGTAEGAGIYGPMNLTFGSFYQPGISSTSIIANNSSSVTALSGDGTIDNISAAGNITLNVNTNVANSFSGTIQNSNGSLALNLNDGSLTLLTHAVTGGNSMNTYSGGTTITSGSLIIGATGAFPAATPVVNNGSFFIYANSTIGQITGNGQLTVGSNTATATATLASKSGISTIASLTINPDSKLDVTNNDLIIHTGTLSYISGLIASAYDSGNWNGSTGITSSLAASKAHGAITLGIGTGLSSFDGQGVLPSDILIKYTWLGDANLDGAITTADLAAISPTGTTWQTGDFNYDGIVNADDYSLVMLGDAASGGINVSNTLPEPAIGMICAGGLLICSSRRRRI